MILVDINDQDPVFTQEVYYFSVPENDRSGESGRFVGQIVALDADQGNNGVVTYNISSRVAKQLFNVQVSFYFQGYSQ